MDKEFVKQNEKYFRWLYDLRRSGVCNMYEAPQRMVEAFENISIEAAWEIFDTYREHFGEVAEFLGVKP